ncbi:hypothetical protein [Janibacter sp. GXQ6167]|uniref:hypothetical protein n=1 Tax=Janibacter sp. GXQ6167 TaxID=3240791 RepID=UPI003524ACC3
MSRRSVGHLAWAAPVLAVGVAAPAMAASPGPRCGTTAAPWQYVEYGPRYGLEAGGTPTDLARAVEGNSSGTLFDGTAYASSYTRIQSTVGELRYRTNGVNNPGNYAPMLESVGSNYWDGEPEGTLGRDWLVYGQNAVSNDRRQAPFASYFTFIAPTTMYNVTLWVADIDAQTDTYQDQIWVGDGAPRPQVTRYNDPTGAHPGNTVISGTGTQSDPWLAAPNISLGTDSSRSLLRLDWAQLNAGQAIALRYSSNLFGVNTKGRWQFVYFSPIRYTTTPCTP